MVKWVAKLIARKIGTNIFFFICKTAENVILIVRKFRFVFKYSI